METAIVNKIEVEFYQEADNEIGSEEITVTINPALIGLINKGKDDYFFTIKTDAWSFDTIEEFTAILEKVKKMVNL